MAEIAASTFILKHLSPLLEDKVQLLAGFKDELVYIKDELEGMRAFLRVADDEEEGDEGLKIWVKQVRDVVHDTEDILDEYMLRFENHHGGGAYASILKIIRSVTSLKARLGVAAAMRRIRSRVKDISERHKIYSNNFQKKDQGSKSIRVYDPREDVMLEKPLLVGIEKPRKQLTDWLISHDLGLRVYSVVGMAGLGKTTLVKEAYNWPQIKRNFTNHLWVAVSNSFVMNELLKDIIQQIVTETKQLPRLQSKRKIKEEETRLSIQQDTNQLEMEINEEENRPPTQQDIEKLSTHQLKRKIYELLWQSKYVIVLDDVWTIDHWDAIKVALPNNNTGSRVILTTRKTEIASKMSDEYQSQKTLLNPLSDDHSWSLFSKKVFPKGCPSNLEELSRDILRKCEGLPLAIVAISGVLATKNKSENEWHSINDNLSVELKDTSEYKRMERILSLSYNDLPYYLKCCFLYLSVFPMHHLIEQTRLVRLWAAEGFIIETDEKTPETVAESYLHQLIDRSLLQVAEHTSDGRVKLFRIHDVLRAIIKAKSKDQNFAAVVAEHTTTQFPEKVRRLSLHNTLLNVIQQKRVSKIRSLFMFGVLGQISKSSMPILFSRGLKMLTVLDLKGAPIEIFPNAVVRLFHLRYLSLRDTKVSIIPTSIQNLQNLETLDLKRTLVDRLPDEILKLKRLRHLMVYRYEIKSYTTFGSKQGFQASSKIGGWESMQKLCFIEADKLDNHEMVIQLGKLKHLRRLGIVKLKSIDGGNLCTSIENMSSLRALSLTSIAEDEIIDLGDEFRPPKSLERIYLTGRLVSLPAWLSSLSGLVRVSLKWSQLTSDPLTSLEKLPSLVHLELLQVCGGDTLCFGAEKFQNLKRLTIDKLDALESIIVQEKAMPLLEKLIIQRCRRLKKVPSGIESLGNLKLLEFFDMPDELILSISAVRGGKDHWKVEHIPEVYSIYWTDDCWQTTSLQKPSKEEKVHKPSTSSGK